MATYAQGTSVPVERSRGEIERTLTRFGATEFMYAFDQTRAMVQFTAEDRRVRFVLPLPGKNEHQFTHTPTGQVRKPSAVLQAWEQGCREQWRALAAVVKAKLVAVESGVVDFEEEFAAHIVLPDNSTVGEWLLPQIRRSYETHTMPPMLPDSGRGALELEPPRN